jgi:hypothetical protein
MTPAQPSHSDTDTPSESTTDSGPVAHEDLTIAEQLETMRVRDEHRPGEVCFLGEDGRKRWVAESEVARFIRRLGATHPSDYLAAHGTPWQNDLFSGF